MDWLSPTSSFAFFCTGSTAGFFLSSLYCSLERLAQVALFKSATTAKERIPNPDSSIRSNTKFKCYITVIMLTLSRQRVTILTFVFKNFLPAYFSTDISISFTLESPINQLSLAENIVSLSSIQPILGPIMSTKEVFAAKRLCTVLIFNDKNK